MKISEKKLKVLLPLAVMAVGAIIAVVLIKSRAPVPMRQAAEYAPLVRVLEVQPQNIQLVVTTQGTVKPRTEGELVAEVSGKVTRVAAEFAAGGFFEKDDVLLQIDSRDYELAVVTARSQVAQAKVRYEMEAAQAQVAREEWKQLGDGGDSPLATRELQLSEAKASLEAAKASLERATRNLERTSIRAPYPGRVRARLVDLGEYVAPGVPVASVFAVDYAEIRLPVPDDQLAYVDLPVDYRDEASRKKGPEVRLFADFAGGRHQWKGFIVRVEGEIDPKTRMVHAIVQVKDPYGRDGSEGSMPLAAGMFVEAEIAGYQIAGAYTVPRSALRDRSILVVDGESKLRFRDVEILRIERERVVITGGLEPGESVCISNLEAVSDGMNVRTYAGGNKDAPDGETAKKTGGES